MSYEKQVFCADYNQFVTTKELLIRLLTHKSLIAVGVGRVSSAQHGNLQKAKLLIWGLSLNNYNFLMR